MLNNKNKSNMYPLAVCTWSPFVGCKYDCVYCRNSFQAQAKRQKQNCMKCYNFEPHEHPERLDQQLPKTDYMQFIFTCSMGDISFCSTSYLHQIANRIWAERDKTFLIQSKNPKTFERVDWPNNVILGTTIETDKEITGYYSKAPYLMKRCLDFAKITHPVKMITCEPIMDFCTAALLGLIGIVKPQFIWIGYDSKKNDLPEPPLEKVQQLHWELSKLGIPVILKKIPDSASETPIVNNFQESQENA